MAITTVDFYLLTTDGWTLVATNPASLLVKPSNFLPWRVAITAGGAPAASLLGVQMGKDSYDRDETFECGSVTGEVYIRLDVAPDSSQALTKAHFGVVRDQ